MKRWVRSVSVRLVTVLALAAAALTATSSMVPAQHTPCNPNIQTCL